MRSSAPFALAVLLAACAARAEAQTGCAAATTQLEINRCAAEAYAAADADLNARWPAALAAMSGVGDGGGDATSALRAAQRAWIAYRDLACEAEALPYQGGSIQPSIRLGCLTRLTRQRSDDLLAIAEK